MRGGAVDAVLAQDIALVARLVGAVVPPEVLDRPTSFAFAKLRLDEDKLYQPWSARAIVLAGSGTMIGHIRFHSRPDPVDLHPFARDAVEFGYTIFPDYRRQGYAAEASGAMMAWAQAMFGVRNFVATISPNNVASLALIARLGFELVGQVVDEVEGFSEWGSREWTRPYQGIIALIDEGGDFSAGIRETGVTPMATCPSPKALRFMLHQAGFVRAEIVVPPAGAYEQHARGKRVVCAAWK